MMQNLVLSEGDVVHFQNATLPKVRLLYTKYNTTSTCSSPPKQGTFVKLQPHTSDFLDISNPKAVLERTLRGYSCLTMGDTICLHYNGKKYYIDVVDAKPGNAISVIETDCEVDFAPPHDYVEPTREVPMADTAPGPAAEAPPEEEPSGFSAFQGAAYRVDGKAAEAPRPASAASTASGSGRPASAAAKPAGKVVFGTGGNRLLSKKGGGERGPVGSKDAEEKKKEVEEEPRFQAFSGKGYSLKG